MEVKEFEREMKILKAKEDLEKLKHKNHIAEIKLKHEFDMESEKYSSDNHFGLYKLKRADNRRESTEQDFKNYSGVNG